MKELAVICLRSANRSRHLALTASDAESRAAWHASANHYMALFWAAVYGTYGRA